MKFQFSEKDYTLYLSRAINSNNELIDSYIKSVMSNTENKMSISNEDLVNLLKSCKIEVV